MGKYYRVVATLISFIMAAGFSSAQQVISTAGGYYKNGNGSISVTLGEMAIQTYGNGTNLTTEGFQQTFPVTLLPLNLLSFTANLVNGQTQLRWVTAQEVNSSYFDVERAIAGSAFTKLLTVKSDDNDVTENDYQAVDPSPVAGADYYRLKEVDLDGKYTYSPIVFVKLAAGLSCMVYPNPTHGEVFISIQSPAAKAVVINLYDLSGQLLLQKQAQVAAGASQFNWDMHPYAAGTYFIRFTGIDLPVVKVVKQ
jgi:trimeric autotransporter adhesin